MQQEGGFKKVICLYFVLPIKPWTYKLFYTPLSDFIKIEQNKYTVSR